MLDMVLAEGGLIFMLSSSMSICFGLRTRDALSSLKAHSLEEDRFNAKNCQTCPKRGSLFVAETQWCVYIWTEL